MKKNLFSPDAPLYRFLKRCTDLVCVNILFILGCIPCITIGNSITAMMDVLLRLADNDDVSIIRTFFTSYIAYWKKSLPAGLILSLASLAAGIDYIAASLTSGIWQAVLTCICGAVIFLVVFFFVWIWYVILRTPSQEGLLLSCIYHGIGRLPLTLVMALIWALPLLVVIAFHDHWPLLIPTYLFIAFSLPAYGNAIILNKYK